MISTTLHTENVPHTCTVLQTENVARGGQWRVSKSRGAKVYRMY